MSKSQSSLVLPVFFRSAIFSAVEGGFPIERTSANQRTADLVDVFVVHLPSLASLRADDHDEMSALAISPAGLALASPLRVTGKPPAPYRLVAAFPIARPDQPQATPAILSSRRRAHSSPTSPPPSSPQAISPPPVASPSGSRHAPVAPRVSAPSSSPRRSPPATSRPRRVTPPRRRSTTPA